MLSIYFAILLESDLSETYSQGQSLIARMHLKFYFF